MNKIFSIFFFILSPIVNGSDAKYFSRYTGLQSEDCIGAQEHSESYHDHCPAFYGYEILLHVYAPTVLEIIPPGQRPSFSVAVRESTLGKVLEWRYEKKRKKFHDTIKLNAFIFRGIPDDSQINSKTLLYVVKISADKICLIAKIPPQKNQNNKAHKIADNPLEYPCLSES